AGWHRAFLPLPGEIVWRRPASALAGFRGDVERLVGLDYTPPQEESMKRQVAMIVGVLSMGLPQLTQANWGDLFRPFGGTGWVSLAWFDVVGPIPTAVSSHYQDPDDRVTVAVDTGTGAARFVRF